MLPRKIPRPAKRASRWRSVSHCNFVRLHECSTPDCYARPIEVAHVCTGSGAGIAQKPDDWHTISLCRFHHQVQHRHSEATFAKAFGIDLHALAAEFAAKSPKAAEISKVKREREREHG